MSSNRVLAAAAACALTLAGLHTASHAGFLVASANNGPGNTIEFHWNFQEYPDFPSGTPEWVGYDVLRRPLGCGAFMRVNDEPYPRIVGQSHGYTYTEPAPHTGTMYQYRVILVDANRQQIFPAGCDCAAHDGWASYPDLSAPLTEGTLEDWGWALFVHPTPGSCYSSFYFENQNQVEELRPLAGTDAVVRFYAHAYCGTVEGCGMTVYGYYIVPDDPTVAQRRTWGQLKLLYR